VVVVYYDSYKEPFLRFNPAEPFFVDGVITPRGPDDCESLSKLVAEFGVSPLDGERKLAVVVGNGRACLNNFFQLCLAIREALLKNIV
jgi:hypothetical protein